MIKEIVYPVEKWRDDTWREFASRERFELNCSFAEWVEKTLTTLPEPNWDADEHDPAEIPDLWPVECWDDCDLFARHHLFFDSKNKSTCNFNHGARSYGDYGHYRMIKKEAWPKWMAERHTELVERYKG